MRRWRRSGFVVATAVMAAVCALVALAGFAGVASAADSVVVPDGGVSSSFGAPAGDPAQAPPTLVQDADLGRLGAS